jgi:DNA-3-methyladenine glycosylase II
MELDAQTIRIGLDQAAAREPRIAGALARVGYPPPRIRPRGYPTLLRTIVGQQVSVAAAASVWNRLEILLGPDLPPERLLAADFDSLRGCGLSRQKQGYARSLAELVVAGDLDLAGLPEDDEAAIQLLTRIKGVGRWSAEIYLLFAERRTDIWPAGDLAIQAGLARMLELPQRPNETSARALGDPFRPYRGALALLAWQIYNNPAL